MTYAGCFRHIAMGFRNKLGEISRIIVLEGRVKRNALCRARAQDRFRHMTRFLDFSVRAHSDTRQERPASLWNVPDAPEKLHTAD